jgi:predicted nucleic acid-binding protein
MKLVLDASSVLAWFVQRSDPREAGLADAVFQNIERDEAVVPALWSIEVVNGLLVAERTRQTGTQKTALFLSELAALPIVEDRVRPLSAQGDVLRYARKFGLTAYDATYLELALRTGRTLATFDGKLASAMRQAGGRVFGD